MNRKWTISCSIIYVFSPPNSYSSLAEDLK